MGVGVGVGVGVLYVFMYFICIYVACVCVCVCTRICIYVNVCMYYVAGENWFQKRRREGEEERLSKRACDGEVSENHERCRMGEREERERERCVEAARGVGGDSAGGGRGDGGESGGLQISRLQQQVIEIYDSD